MCVSLFYHVEKVAIGLLSLCGNPVDILAVLVAAGDIAWDWLIMGVPLFDRALTARKGNVEH